MRIILLLAVMGFIAVASFIVGQQAQPAALVRKSLLAADINPAKATSRLEVWQIDFAPLQQTGTHEHPIPVVGYLAQGEITFQIEGQPPKTLHAGDACLEPAHVKILHFDNASSTEQATYIAFYLMGDGDHDLIHMLNE